MSPRIVAKVTLPRSGTCFIVTSYNREFDKLSQLLRLAAADPFAGLTALRADDLAKGDEFPKAVFDAIRAARLVVVVYISDPETGQVSANVIYELGLASSLRKPILIVTTEADQKKIPSDASHVTHMICKLSSLIDATTQTQKELTFEMKRVLDAAEGPLTDLRFDDTHSEEDEIPTAALWHGVNQILESTRNVWQHLSPAQREIQVLCDSAHVLFSNPGQDTTQFIIRWRHYNAQRSAPLTHPLTRLVVTYNDFLQRFEKFLDPTVRPRRSVDIYDGLKVGEFFQSVQRQISELSQLHLHVDNELNDLGKSSWKDKQGSVYSACLRIPLLLDVLMNDLYRLLWNVLEVVARNVEKRISPRSAAAWG